VTDTGPFEPPGLQGLTVWDGSGTHTYSDLERRRDAIASELRRYFLSSADPLCIVMSANIDSVAALLAAARQRSVLLLPPSLHAEELETFLDSSRVHGILASEGDAGRLGLPLRWRAKPLTSGIILFTPLSSQISEQTGLASTPAGSVCQVTSGSTSASRLAVRTGSGIALEIESVARAIGLNSSDRVLVSSSVAHSYGLMGGLLASLRAGAEVALVKDADAAVNMIGSWRPTVIFGLPPVYEALLASDRTGQMADVRLCLCAGAPLPVGLHDFFMQSTGLQLRQDYGTTEAGTIAIDIEAPAHPESVGRPLGHMEVRLVPTAGQSVDEAVVRSAAVASWYIGENGFLESSLDHGGWFHTGDAGEWDESGRLSLKRRIRSLVEVRGHPVDPYSLEQLLKDVPGVKEAAVYKHRDGGLRAVLVPKIGWAEREGMDRVRTAGGEFIDAIELRPALPRSPAGKVLYKYL
jgi:acyl-CoA synthetase (AMP-forming)/AMP-acid ligase II